MQVYSNLADLAQGEDGFGLALGVFDGVHLGHQAVINAARGTTRTGVLSFHPLPVQVLAPERAPDLLLSSLEDKKRLLSSLGIDFLVVLEFDKRFAETSAKDFADYLFQSGVRKLAAGEDWTFGRGREGTMPRLFEWGSEHGVEVISVPAVIQEGERISSTRIRQCLLAGDLEGAQRLLGRPYGVYGKVVKGRQLGRTIGFRTANLSVSSRHLPPNGVYCVRGNGIEGVANIGVKPTIGGESERSLEVHLFSDRVADDYQWDLEVTFFSRIREEKQFADLHELKSQIERDIICARERFVSQG